MLMQFRLILPGKRLSFAAMINTSRAFWHQSVDRCRSLLGAMRDGFEAWPGDEVMPVRVTIRNRETLGVLPARPVEDRMQ